MSRRVQDTAHDCDGGERDRPGLPPPKRHGAKEDERKVGCELAARHDAVEGCPNPSRQRKSKPRAQDRHGPGQERCADPSIELVSKHSFPRHSRCMTRMSVWRQTTKCPLSTQTCHCGRGSSRPIPATKLL